MKNRIEKSKATEPAEAKPTPTPTLRTEYTLELTVWEMDDNDLLGDGDAVASVEISTRLFKKILKRAECLGIAPGRFLEEMATDAVRYDSATIKRLEVA